VLYSYQSTRHTVITVHSYITVVRAQIVTALLILCYHLEVSYLIIIIIIITHLYSAFEVRKYRGTCSTGGLSESEKMIFQVAHSLMSAGKEFQMDGAATEKARRANTVCVRETTCSGASDERRAHVGTCVCTRSLRYTGVAVVCTL